MYNKDKPKGFHTTTPPKAMTTTPTKKKANSLDAAHRTAETIQELYNAWKFVQQDRADSVEKGISDLPYEQQIAPLEEARELPLSVNVRSCWVEVGSKMDAFQFRIEMSTGGPAVAIFGTVSNGYPIEPEIKHQDWFTPWEYSHNKTSQDEDITEALEWFCSLFYFGD